MFKAIINQVYVLEKIVFANILRKVSRISFQVFIMETDDLMDFSSVDFENFATVENFLSRGVAGDVYGAISLNKRNYAIKKVLFEEDSHDAMTKKVETKTNIWTSLEHRNLIKIHFVQVKPIFFCILMEFAAGGSLSSTLRIVRQMHTNLPVYVVSDWSEQIANGMLYLHERKLVHRDLKPGNSE